eukprot:Rmarinus@m.14402
MAGRWAIVISDTRVSDEDWDRALAVLPDKDCEHVQRFELERDQQTALCSRVLQRGVALHFFRTLARGRPLPSPLVSFPVPTPTVSPGTPTTPSVKPFTLAVRSLGSATGSATLPTLLPSPSIMSLSSSPVLSPARRTRKLSEDGSYRSLESLNEAGGRDTPETILSDDEQYRFARKYAQSGLVQLGVRPPTLTFPHKRNLLPPKEVNIENTPEGKPYVLMPSWAKLTAALWRCENWNFSLSHHGDIAVVATEGTCAVGCDVVDFEWIECAAYRQLRCKQAGQSDPMEPGQQRDPAEERAEAVESYLHLTRGQFHEREWEILDATLDAGRCEEALRLFGALWAAKEAYAKALGVGLSLPFERLEFRLVAGVSCADLAELLSRAFEDNDTTCSVSHPDVEAPCFNLPLLLYLDGEEQTMWRFQFSVLRQGRYLTCLARGDPSDVCRTFRATLTRPERPRGELEADLATLPRPFQYVTFEQLLLLLEGRIESLNERLPDTCTF